jgi:DNA-binding transcriptional LysR family regulator
MNARQIEVFHAVMKTGSISGAASLLRVSQPAVSQVLLHTEDQLRFPLFHRVKGRLQETAQARLLYREVENVYDGLKRVRSLADSLRDRSGGAIHVLASPGPGHSILPEALGLFRIAYPHVRVTLDLLSYGPMVEKMKSQEADLAVAMCPSTETTLTASHLCTSTLFCLLPPGHPLCQTETVTPRDLRGHPLIAFSGASAVGKLVARALHAAGEEPDVAVAVPFGTNTYNLVSAGIGVAIVDGFTANGAKAFGLQVRPFDCVERLEVVILQNSERPPTKDVEAFVVLLQETARLTVGSTQGTSCSGSARSTNSSSPAEPSFHIRTTNLPASSSTISGQCQMPAR